MERCILLGELLNCVEDTIIIYVVIDIVGLPRLFLLLGLPSDPSVKVSPFESFDESLIISSLANVDSTVTRSEFSELSFKNKHCVFHIKSYNFVCFS